MDFTQLRYFIAVAEELNFRRAAERLHMSQPPLSLQIAQLEGQLGVQLIERNPGARTRLTAAGAGFLEDARRILALAEQAAERACRTGKGEIGSLSVGLTSSMAYGAVPLLLRDFRNANPGLKLQLRELTTAQQEKSLREGTLDLGFCYHPLENADFQTLPVHEETVILALPETHPLTRKTRVALTSLRGESFLSFPRQVSPGLYDLILTAFAQAGFAPNIAQEATQMQTLIALVCAGLGVAVVPESMEKLTRPGVEYRFFSKTMPAIQTVAVWREEALSPAAARLLDFIRHLVH
jgi:DNA-binding transcriptional LysR family regulator